MTTIGRMTFSKRLTAVIMALAVLILSMPAVDLTAFAAGAPWEGSGTADDPWRIETAEDLLSIYRGDGTGWSGRDYAGKYLALMKDIDMTGVSFGPIGFESGPFAGTFYGCGRTVSGLEFSYGISDNIGLFAAIKGACIEDLTVSGTFKGVYNIGGIAGKSEGGNQIRNCSFRGKTQGEANIGGIIGYAADGDSIVGCINYGTDEGVGLVGGIAGYTNKSTIQYCFNCGFVTGGRSVGGIAGFSTSDIGYCENTVTGTVSSNQQTVTTLGSVGGIAGFSASDIGYRENTVTGTVSNNQQTDTAPGSVGGIVGVMSNVENGKLHHCSNFGSVGRARYVDHFTGGIVGYCVGDIEWNLNAGEVIGDLATGGIAGLCTGSVTKCYNSGNVSANSSQTGGIVGDGKVCAVEQCYNSGSVRSSGDSVGGLVGYLGQNSLLSDCYNIGTVIEGSNNVGGLVGCAFGSSSTIRYCYNWMYDELPKATADNGVYAKTVAGYSESIPTMQYNYFTDYNTHATGWDNTRVKEKYIYLYNREMKDQSCFTGFNFSGIWRMTDTRPDLQFSGSAFYYGSYSAPLPKTFTALEPARYSISVSEADFGTMSYGGTPPERTICIYNTGTRKLFAPSLSSADFEFSGPSSSDIPAGGSVSYTVKPKTGLTVGTYNIPLTVTASNRSCSASANTSLLLKVSRAYPTLSVSIENWKCGHQAKTPVLTVNNTGMQPTFTYKACDFCIYSDAPWEGGGTEADPWQIKSSGDLEAIAENICEPGLHDAASQESYRGKYFKLSDDIDMSGVSHTPIGREGEAAFSGTFDGGGHILYNLKGSYDQKDSGVFGYISGAVIKDLCAAGEITSSRECVGGLVGSAFKSVIENCAFIGDVTGGGSNVGGLAGVTDRCFVRGSFHVGNVKGEVFKKIDGISGVYNTEYYSYEDHSFRNCYHLGNIISPYTEKYPDFISGGGIVGSALVLLMTGFDMTPNTFAAGEGFNHLVEEVVERRGSSGEILTEEELKELEFGGVTGWDFANTWITGENYPILREFAATVTFGYGENSKSDPGETEDVTVLRTTSVTAPENTPAAGYIFGGWDTKQDGTGERYQPGDDVPAFGNITLYAQYSREVPNYTLSPEITDLGTQTYGYTAFDPAVITLTNNGVLEEKFTVSVSDKLEVVGDATASAASGKTAAFTVKPKTGLSAGKYTETVTVSTESYPDLTKSVTVTFEVGKAEHKVTAPKALTLYCNGKPQALVKAGKCSTGTVLYSLSKNGTYSKSIPTATEGGEYTVWYYVKAAANYNASSKKSVKVTITDDRLMGDVDGNKVVDVLDLTITARYLARWTGYEEDKYDFTVCDFDGNGKTDVADYAILARSLARWNGYRETYLLSVKEYRSKA